jgi:mannose/fructose/N-acetylgalactosamine-specific phosphotransferase system component IIC
MRCSYCRKEISLSARICPYCHKNTAESQLNTVQLGLPLFICGVLGWVLGDFFFGFFYGAGVGLVLGILWIVLSGKQRTRIVTQARDDTKNL